MQVIQPPVHLCIVGTGLIGGFIGSCFLNLPEDFKPTFIGREKLIDAVKQHGISVTRQFNARQNFPPETINISASLDDAATADIVFVCVKSQDTAIVSKKLKDVIKSTAIVVSLQNGIRNTQTLRQELPHNPIIGGIIPFNVIQEQATHYRQTTSGEIVLESSPSTPSVEALFKQSHLPVRSVIDIAGLQWTKLLMNLNNPVNALAGIPLAEQLQIKEYRLVTAACIEEALHLLKAHNIKTQRYGSIIPELLPTILRLPNGMFKMIAKKMISIDPLARSSMYDDLKRGRKTEIEFLNGEIEYLGKQLQHNSRPHSDENYQASPVNSRIIALIKNAESRDAGSPEMSAEDLLKQIHSY
ncbi:hypothetical protein TDB9533_00283 [Thalassocella blandensis]|nr:hypothetical protein TDB9533_00283 [Thalassocella blandensis]